MTGQIFLDQSHFTDFTILRFFELDGLYYRDKSNLFVRYTQANIHVINKLAKSSKFLSPPQADGVLRNFAPSGTDFAKTWNPRSKLRGIPTRINIGG